MKVWVISVGGKSGSYMFEGSISEAEVERKKKANHDGAPVRKRLADDDEVESEELKDCKNHRNFNSRLRFTCKCGNC